ncbi:MAG: hypothetical protein LBM64_03430 [Deltaproteobacteria bacterium]|jgi:hypothetical protein|nr:hypothetical protein [Deltaproteobacteria bacterium]
MRYPACLFLLALFMAINPAPTQSRAQTAEEQITIRQGGKRVSVSAGQLGLGAVENSELRYAALSLEQGELLGLKAGLYLFDAAGLFIAFAPTAAAEFCGAVSLSPDGNLLAMDSGTQAERYWDFYTYPDMRHVSGASYLAEAGKPPLLWHSRGRALLTTVREDAGRFCDYAPCGPTSVILYDVFRGKGYTLMNGTDLCDYRMDFLLDNKLAADKICLPTLQDWNKQPENPPAQKITVTLPE